MQGILSLDSILRARLEDFKREVTESNLHLKKIMWLLSGKEKLWRIMYFLPQADKLGDYAIEGLDGMEAVKMD